MSNKPRFDGLVVGLNMLKPIVKVLTIKIKPIRARMNQPSIANLLN